MSKIKSIVKKQITTEKLYNLAVLGDESFIANDIVVHNCRSVLVPMTIYEQYDPTKKINGKTVNSFIKSTQHKGFEVL